MKNKRFQFWFGVSLAVQISSPACGIAATRQFSFSDKFITGKLSLRSTVNLAPLSTPAPTAKGKVVVTVEPGQTLFLELNSHCLENPDQLLSMPTKGIDGIRLSYMSMEENVHVCDDALKSLPPFSGPLVLECTRTDVSDVGLKAFKSIDLLTSLNCFMSDVNGSFLSDIRDPAKLVSLNLSNNPLKKENFKYVNRLVNLKKLTLRQVDLDDNALAEICKNRNLICIEINENPNLTDLGIIYLARCQKVETINVAHDRKITNKSLSVFANLPHLKSLDLRSTQITPEGLEKLDRLCVDNIVLSQEWGVKMDRLRKKFPQSHFKCLDRTVPTETQIQFAPLK